MSTAYVDVWEQWEQYQQSAEYKAKVEREGLEIGFALLSLGVVLRPRFWTEAYWDEITSLWRRHKEPSRLGLTLREFGFVCLIAGYGVERPYRSIEAAAVLCCTFEEARRLEARAIRKLRHPTRRGKRLEDFLD